MTIVDMLEQSGVLTLLGMGIVFSFLVILIISISLVGKLIRTLGIDKDGAANSPSSPGKTPVAAPAASSAGGAAVTAAISAAVNEYRKTNS